METREEEVQQERSRLKKNMEVLRARESELSEKLKEAERQRQTNQTLKKGLADKEADLREREKEIEEKRKMFDQKELRARIEKLEGKVEEERDQRKRAEQEKEEMKEQVQSVCEKNKSIAHDLKEVNGRLEERVLEVREKEERIQALEGEREELEQRRKRVERQLEELKKMESEGSEAEEKQLTPKAEEELRVSKLEQKVGSLKQLVAQKVGQLAEKDEIIQKHEGGVLYYETTLQELQKQLREKTEAFDTLNAQLMERERSFFPTSPQMETTLPSEQTRFKEQRRQKEEEEDYEQEEIVYVKFDLSVLEADESELLQEVKEENKALREEIELRVEKLKRQREVMEQLEDGKIEAEKALQEKSEEMRRFHSMLKHKEQEFKQWREKIDDLERYSRELEVKLARTEASLKIALHKYNESYHRLKALSSQTKEQEMQELGMKEKISELTKQKHKLEAQVEETARRVKQTGGKINYLENFIYQQKEELSNKESILYKMQQQVGRAQEQNEEQKQLLKSTELRLRQVSVTKVKDWQKKFEKQEKEKKIMEEMVRSVKIEQQFKDAELKKLERKIKRLEKMLEQRVQAERSDRTEAAVSTSPSRRSSEHTRSNQRLKKINEVEENLETTHTQQKFNKVPSHESLPEISRTPNTVKAMKNQKGSTERYLARQYETPPVKKTYNMLGGSTPLKQKRLLPSQMHRQIFKRVNTFSKGGQRLMTESSTPSPVNDRMESPDGGRDETMSKFSEIRAARLKKAAESPFWRQQIDNQYEDYVSSIGRSNSKNSSMGLRKVLFQPGNEETAPLIYNQHFLERFKPS